MVSNEDFIRPLAEDLEAKGAFAFFEEQDIYDLEFTVDANLGFKSGRAMIACGGPNIYVDSRGSVDLYWWTEEAHWFLTEDCKADVKTYFEDLFHSMSK